MFPKYMEDNMKLIRHVENNNLVDKPYTKKVE